VSHVHDHASPARVCGPCTACCDGWLKITIEGQSVEPGRKCQFSSGTDCTNYAGRPVDPCQKFTCGWLAKQSPLPDWMRPDKGRVILLASYFKWHNFAVDVAVPVAEGIAEDAFAWLTHFAASTKRLLIYQLDKEWYAFGPPDFQSEMAERIKKQGQFWSSQIAAP